VGQQPWKANLPRTGTRRLGPIVPYEFIPGYQVGAFMQVTAGAFAIYIHPMTPLVTEFQGLIQGWRST